LQFQEIRQKMPGTREMQARSAQFAPNLLHPAVDGLHSTDFSADKTPSLFIDSEVERSKNNLVL
jgi:hypothetical protein